MEDLQLWDGMIGALAGALIGLVPAVLAWRAAVRANSRAAEANDISRRSLAEAQRSAAAAEAANSIASSAVEENSRANGIADQALEEARQARKIQYADWHRQAKPHITLLLHDDPSDEEGYPLEFSCDRDIDSGSISLVDGWDRRVIKGLGASPDEQVFNFGEAVTLSALKAGASATKGLWITNASAAEGQDVRLRCEVTIDGDSWSDVQTIELPTRFWIK
ncbi:hypothetical protein EV652_10327 [Kribbella steppae]|uniref:Uncharacterized protein n=1 Tax=Kribbella steppae TaxID=2512223 RepID=A0A4R2HRC5_9ACTN|nr:hypothetical protein [Kribbella steppae]TCO33028.1 hypothetical protein EV652_10327 [Kribbella steppae]